MCQRDGGAGLSFEIVCQQLTAEKGQHVDALACLVDLCGIYRPILSGSLSDAPDIRQIVTLSVEKLERCISRHSRHNIII